MRAMPIATPSPLRHDWPWWAFPLQALGLFLLHGALPFGLSRLSTRHGWSAGHPSLGNWSGLLLVAGGIALIAWAIALHREAAPRHGWRMEKSPFEPTQYLIVRGPYRYTRNPIYVAHLAIWIGWTIFYGSAAVGIGLAIIWHGLVFLVVPYEERGLARERGEAYAEYCRRVARWIGRPAR